MKPVGLPHSEIPGSQVASTFPGRFAGSRVLHRLRVPRHPPYALGSLPKAFLQVDGSVWRFYHHNKTIGYFNCQRAASVDPNGLEPLTSRMQIWRSPS